MMFGHLKAEEFMNLLEGAALPDKRRSHLSACARCASTFAAVQGVQTKVTELSMAADEHIPEPDWADFRADVRTHLLSRSVKRETAANHWMGMTWRPAMVWSLSVMFVLGLTAGLLMWNKPEANPATGSMTFSEAALSPESLAELGAVSELSGWAETDVFEAVIRLNADETESLQRLLEEVAPKGSIQ